MNARVSFLCHLTGTHPARSLRFCRNGTTKDALTRRLMARRRMRFIMICYPRLSVLDLSRARDGRAVHHVPLRTPRSRTTVALAFALMCAIIRVGSTCRLSH